MEVTEADVQKLRVAFFNKVAQTGNSETELFHSNDINRVKTNDAWLRRFLLHQDNDPTLALNMLWEACEWRASFGTNDLTEETINMRIVQDGSIFPRNRDKDGRALLIFKSKKHVKGKHDFQELKRVLIYWMERLEREENGEPISIFFDMDGAGLSNMDMDYTKYIISLFKLYYPFFLNNIYIFEMAWVLNAAFKVIKTWLPPKAVEKIKFISKSNLKEYVAPEQSLKSWGGEDNYEFEFITEIKPAVETERKKVHFADKVPSSDETENYPDTQDTPSHRLIISPDDGIQFILERGETTATFQLKSEESIPISFKIKTTSPEKFRVRPSTGVVNRGQTVPISLQLLPGFDLSSLDRDKFLVLSVPVLQEFSNLNQTELWAANNKRIIQHRLRCFTQSNNTNIVKNENTANADRQITKLSNELNSLRDGVKADMQLIKIQNWILILTTFCLFFFVVIFSNQRELCVPPPATAAALEACQDPELLSFVASQKN